MSNKVCAVSVFILQRGKLSIKTFIIEQTQISHTERRHLKPPRTAVIIKKRQEMPVRWGALHTAGREGTENSTMVPPKLRWNCLTSRVLSWVPAKELSQPAEETVALPHSLWHRSQQPRRDPACVATHGEKGKGNVAHRHRGILHSTTSMKACY